MTSEPAPIRRRKLADEVEERILALIRDNGLKPGDTLPSERELMSRYQIGRPSIREAMQNLQRMGLAEVRHGERPRVAAPSMEMMTEQMAQSMRHLLTHSAATMQHLKEARIAFETGMARIAAERRTDDDIETLKAVLKQQKSAKKDSAAFLESDGAFHRAIAQINGNPIFESLSQSLFDWLAHFHVDMVHRPGHEKVVIAEHQAILDSIEAGDPESAGRNMADHLNRAKSLYQADTPNS